MALDPVTAGIELVKQVAPKLIDHFLPDPEKASAAKLELEKLIQTGRLAEMTNETETAKAFLSDTASAREREARIATSAEAPRINKVIGPYLAIGIVSMTFVLCGVLAFQADGDLKPSQERIIIFIIGALVPICTQVVSYYFGSSRGDAANSQHLRDLLGKNGS